VSLHPRNPEMVVTQVLVVVILPVGAYFIWTRADSPRVALAFCALALLTLIFLIIGALGVGEPKE
jgi:hypothetical protein